jgi:hypothetical protein
LPELAESSAARRGTEFGNNDQFLELEPKGDDLLAKGGEVVPVAVARFFDQAMRAEPS